jgi:hypothetical protein
MKKNIVLVALAFALAIGASTVMTIHPHSAVACAGNDC